MKKAKLLFFTFLIVVLSNSIYSQKRGNGSNNSNQEVANLYKNNGNGFFSGSWSPFIGVTAGSLAFSDIDNDNDQDVLITGGYSDWPGQTDYLSLLYINNGIGVFSEVAINPFEDVVLSSVAFADIDNDNDQDVLITGYTGEWGYGQPISKLYINDGSGSFIEESGFLFNEVHASSIAFADIDNDNDQDLLITGSNGDSLFASLYRNLTISTDVIEENNLFKSASIFPNPATNEVFISSNTHSIINEVNFYNQIGQKVLHQQWLNNSIDVSNLQPGIYIIELAFGESMVRKKLIIE